MAVALTREAPDPDEVLALAARVAEQDGAPPLSDQTLAQLRSPQVLHISAHDGDELVGYAQREDGSAEIAASADAAADLLDAVTPEQGELLVWSHGTHSRLMPLLESRGFRRERELLQLRRPLDETAPLPADPSLPDDIAVRTFVPGQDDDAWLALNAAAFAHHPEQGRWSTDDLQARLAEPWFDAAGFLLAERRGELLGFHWTKVHRDGLGEVYVLGVAPGTQGLGLGTALLVRGLRFLAEERHCPAALLYVESDNAPALHLYERDGFVRYDVDVQWRSASSGLPTTT